LFAFTLAPFLFCFDICRISFQNAIPMMHTSTINMTFNVFITLRLIQFGKNKQDAGCQMQLKANG